MKPVYLVGCLVACSSMLAGQAAGPSSVEGQVVNGATGAPLRRVAVTMQRSSGRAVRPGEPPQTFSSSDVETDDQGRFAFRDLDAGGYRITTQKQGFVNQTSTAVNFANSQLWLGEGQQLTGYVVRMTPQAVITGKVLDQDGEPVMSAQVYAQRGGYSIAGRPQTVGSVQSNDLGEFRIANLSAGDYFVVAVPQNRNRSFAGNPPLPDKPQLIYTTTYYPGATGVAEAVAVHVADGAEVRGIDVKLAKVNAVSIRGTVVDPGGPPESRAYPQLRPRNGAGSPNMSFGSSIQQDGSFVFAAVPPGSYDLVAQRNNAGPQGPTAMALLPIEVRDKNLDGIVLQVKPTPDLQGTVKVEPASQCDVRNMSVNLAPANGIYYYGSVQPARVGDDLNFTLKSVPPSVYSVNVTGPGRCYVKSILYGGQEARETALAVNGSGPLDITLAASNAMLSVMVSDRQGKPLPRASVSVMSKDGGRPTFTRVGPNGQSQLSIHPGSYDVFAFEDVDLSAAQSPEFLKTLESRAKAVTVGENERATVEVAAIPASESGGTTAPPPRPSAKGSLAGQVVDAVGGAPLRGVFVTLRGQTNTPEGTSAETDDQGHFAFPDLEPGSYSLIAQQQRFIVASAGMSPNPPGQVIVGEGQKISAFVLKLAPVGVIAGTVTDDSGEPILGARVQVYRYRSDFGQPGQFVQRRLAMAGGTQTDDLGKYRIASLAAGDYYVSATPAVRRAIGVRMVDNPPMVFTQTPSTPSIDSIAGPLPAEAEMGYVPVWYPNGSQPAAATAVRLGAGAVAANIDMTLRKSKVVRIRGKVVDAAGALVGTPNITLTPKNSEISGATAGSLTVARDGSFEISGVPPGSYRLIARGGLGIGASINGSGAVMVGSSFGGGSLSMGSSLRMAVQSLDVKESPIEGIRLEVTAGRTVKGSIRMEGGGPVVRSVFMSVTSPEGGGGGAMNVGADGTFAIGNVFPVVYTVNLQNLTANYYVKSIRYGGREVPGTGLEFMGEGELEVVVSGSAAVLEGSVAGADGKPASHAAIVVALVGGVEPVQTGNADARGNFYFASLPPGEYKVLAWDAEAPEAARLSEPLGILANAGRTVKLGENAHEKVQVTVVAAAR